MKRKLFVSYSFRSADGGYGIGNTSAIVTEPITMEWIRRLEAMIRETTGFTSLAIISWQVLEG